MTSDVVTQAAEVLFAMSQAQSSYIMPAGFTYDTDVFKMPMLRGFGDMPDLWVSMSQNDQLKVDAHALIDQAKAGNFGNFADNFDDLLADWAGVADVVWMQDAPELSAAFAFDETEYAEWLVRENDGIAGANPLPTIRGYVFRSGSAFTPDAEYDAQVAAWLATNGYVAPGFDGDISTSGGPQLAVSINGGFTQQTLPFRIVPGTIGGADPTPARRRRAHRWFLAAPALRGCSVGDGAPSVYSREPVVLGGSVERVRHVRRRVSTVRQGGSWSSATTFPALGATKVVLLTFVWVVPGERGAGYHANTSWTSRSTRSRHLLPRAFATRPSRAPRPTPSRPMAVSLRPRRTGWWFTSFGRADASE